jgi:pilus assembly protein CpaB
LKRIRIIAIAAAIVTAVAVYMYLASLNKPVQIARGPVVVAVTQIAAGQEIKAEMVEVKDLPVEAIYPKAARSVEVVVGRVSSSGAEPGEQLLVSRFFKAGEANDTLAYAIERGKRAVTIAVDPVSGVAGLVKPRDHVDILVLINVKQQLWKMNATITQDAVDISYKLGDREDQAYSLMPLQNVLVLATGQVMQADASNDETTVDQVTLSVTPDQAVILNLLASNSQIRLALRSPIDTDTVDIEPKNINDVIPVNTWEDFLNMIKGMQGRSTLAPDASPTPMPLDEFWDEVISQQ